MTFAQTLAGDLSPAIEAALNANKDAIVAAVSGRLQRLALAHEWEAVIAAVPHIAEAVVNEGLTRLATMRVADVLAEIQRGIDSK